ncbi:polysaccharide deacetylase family protein [Paenibacillus silvae]|uniref:polysaccharide deacetylase family protein n=1 Tax=Paenibacillus silvae TaxID=1325358 RepID=UPI0011A448A4|nr:MULTISPECIES: polysaccharide deacetylase family protein [Paenibacillus]MCK6076859.1 polysaccharide deacetylase family protein [Paenibacillus silvae]MCK6152301.1 polysaccharide deacetylase family protein [Paenibacillus silvae]MCK6269634.1 polysaccharide deacetylase family protein [Paenibacillus silvae]
MRLRLIMLMPMFITVMCLGALPLSPAHAYVSTEGTEEQSHTPASTSDTGEEQLTLGQLRQKYADTFKTNGPSTKQVALTFDDVPDPRFTGQVLDVLKKYKVRATFFVVGSRAEKHPDLVKRMVKEGHVIGNHSYNHPEFSKLSMTAFRRQILRTGDIIQRLTGYTPKMIRPPYGDINEEQLRWARKQRYSIVNWNVDSLDWKGLPKEKVKHNILAAVKPGSIVLQHAGGGTGSNLKGTVEALPEVIEELRNQGYDLVTLDEMLKLSKEKQ